MSQPPPVDALGNAGAETSAAAYSMLLLLVTAVIWSSHSLHHSRLTFITDGSLALLWGLAAGGVAFFAFGGVVPPQLISFNYDIYMQLLLPPIIFYAGFSIKRKDFFSNIAAISTLGVLATMLSAALLAVTFSHALHILGLDSARLGNAVGLGTVMASTDSVAALAALDPVAAPQLHALVFGEAVVNDATAIVLLKSVQHVRGATQLTAGALALLAADFLRLAAASMALGAGVGLAAAYILKHSFRRRHSTDHEVSLLAALGFLSFLGADSLGLSGVLAAFFSGIAMSHYAWHSLSPSAKVSSVYGFRVLSFLAELLMFLSCGLDLWSNRLWDADILVKKAMMRKTAALTACIAVSVPAIRFAVALPLVAVINTWRAPGRKIRWREAAALAFAGCARGAVTLALAVNHFLGGGGGQEPDSESRIIAAASMAAVVLSTVVLGGATPVVLGRLLDDRNRGSNGGGGSGDGEQQNQRKQSTTYFTALGREYEQYAALGEPLLLGGSSTQPDSVSVSVPRPARGQPMAGAEAVEDLASSFHSKWTALDRRFLQPLFGGRTLSFREDGGGSPPSPGRWQGAASAVQVLSRGRTATASAVPQRPSPFASTTEVTDEETGGGERQQQGGGFTRRVSSGGLDGLFAAPGHADCEEEVDAEVEAEGLDDQAASFLEH